jgi:RNA polymerase sigma-70 factor (ECF subfamily)
MSIDATQLEAHRTALTGHCYRMLGSAFDADDAVQETMVRAWRGLDRFDGRASLRTWMYRIATNVCLDTLSTRSKRERPITEFSPGTPGSDLETRPAEHWIEPIPDARALPTLSPGTDPHEIATLRQSIRLAFVAALQHLPPRQRAALLLNEVVGLSAAEIADSLDMTVAAVNSALQRARATVSTKERFEAAATLTDRETDLLDRYVDAFERYDVDRLVSLLRDDAALSMPPYTLWLRGPEAIREWMLGRGCGCRGSRLVRVAASGLPACGQYRPGDTPGTFKPWAIIVLELAGERIASITSFLDTEKLFPLFGLPDR